MPEVAVITSVVWSVTGSTEYTLSPPPYNKPLAYVSEFQPGDAVGPTPPRGIAVPVVKFKEKSSFLFNEPEYSTPHALPVAGSIAMSPNPYGMFMLPTKTNGLPGVS